jgi:hypothetical protein
LAADADLSDRGVAGVKLVAAAIAALLLAGCSSLPTLDQVRAHPSPAAAPAAAGPTESGSACADLYVNATAGRPSPGVLECLSPDFRQQWAGAGVSTDQDFAAKVGAWSQMVGWHFVGTDVKGHLIYDLFNKKGSVVIFVIYLDDAGLVADNVYFAYQG